MDKKLQIIGIAGTNGSGKDTVGQILADEHGYLFLSVTELLRAELARRGLPPAREHMRDLSAEWRRQSGLGVLVDKAVAEYEKVKDKYIGVAMASLRNPGEADRIHELGGTIVWVDAEPHVRYDRLQANAVSRGASRAVDDNKTFEQFLAEEAAEMTQAMGTDAAVLNMSAVKDRCDVFINNDGTNLSVLQTNLAQALGL